MRFKKFSLPDLFEAFMHDRRCLSQRSSTPQSSITWEFATFKPISLGNAAVKTLRRKLRSQLARRTRECGNIGVVCPDEQILTESARIAFAYRASQNSGGVMSDSDSTSLKRIQRNDGIQELGPIIESSSSISTDVQTKSSRLCDMLSLLSPVIIEKEDEIPYGERCHRALLNHRSICTNVIVESQCPDTTPHIVITPPPEQDVYDASYRAKNNQTPFQYHPFLPVPPLCLLTCRMMNFEQCRTMFHHQFPSCIEPVHRSTPANRLVFNRTKFTQWVNGTEEHRHCLFRRSIIPAVTRHLFKASVLTASTLAPTFRSRYDSTEFLESLENPFRWTDPASALLPLYHGHPVGVHHIPSPEPFSVPHILIEESFGNDQTIMDGNVPPIPDSANRNSLFIPARPSSSLSSDSLETEYISSSCQSSSLKTPTHREVDYGFFSSWEIGAPFGDVDSPQTQFTGTMRSYRASKALFCIGEEEEEDEYI